MDERSFRKALTGLPIGAIRFYDQTGSTNDVALAWATAGAPDLSLVYSEEQTAGRGRGSRSWFTPPDAALAFTLVFRPSPQEQSYIPLFSAVGALAVSQVLASEGLHPEIKWPNDVLLRNRKVCGILAESTWDGNKVDSLVVGIGINIKPASVPPPEQLNFPATCLEGEILLQNSEKIDQVLDRPALLRQVLLAVISWRQKVGSDSLIHAWESQLAFRGEQVQIWGDAQPVRVGWLEGLEPDGSLRLKSPVGEIFTVHFGEIHLRPVGTGPLRSPG